MLSNLNRIVFRILSRKFEADCFTFEGVILPLISFACEVEAKECVTSLSTNYFAKVIPNWVVEQVVAGNDITIL